MTPDEIRIKKLQNQVTVIEDTLHTLIVWMASSAVSPISITEAEKLIKMLEIDEVK